MQKNFWKVAGLSTGLLLLFSTFFTALGLAGKVFADNGMGMHGFNSLAVLYSAFAIGNLHASDLVTRYGPRSALVLTAVTNACFLSAFILPT